MCVQNASLSATNISMCGKELICAHKIVVCVLQMLIYLHKILVCVCRKLIYFAQYTSICAQNANLFAQNANV